MCAVCDPTLIVRYQWAQETKEYNNSPSNRSLVNLTVYVSQKMTFKVYILGAKVVIIYYTNNY